MSNPTKLTVMVTADARAALESIAEWQGDTRTDSVNRALIGWDAVLRLVEVGGGELEFSHADGRTWQVSVTAREIDPKRGDA